MDPSRSNDAPSELLLRLEIPLPKNVDQEDMRITWQYKDLNHWLYNYFDLRPPTIIRAESDFSDTLECSYQLSMKPGFPVRARQLIAHVIRCCFDDIAGQYVIGRESRGSIILHSKSWFINEIESCFEEVPLTAIHFGVFHCGQFNNHWEVSFKETELHSAQLQVGCYFDQNNITATFWNREMALIKDPSSGKRSPGFAFYKVQIQIQTIRRIVVDLRNEQGAMLYLELTTPAIVKRMVGKDKKDAENRISKRWLRLGRGPPGVSGTSGETCLVENPVVGLHFTDAMNLTTDLNKENGSYVISDQFWFILSRLRIRCNVPIEFCRLDMYTELFGFRMDPYCKWVKPEEKCRQSDSPATHPEERFFKDFLATTFGDHSDSQVKEDKRMVHYLIEALICRGSIVKDHILRRDDRWTLFLRIISECYRTNPQACIEALKRLLIAVDEQKRMDNIHEALQIIFKRLQCGDESYGISEDERKDGYQLVPRVVITPTRNLRIQPEMCMGNRVLRGQNEGEGRHDISAIIRVSFRDDDNAMMRITKTSDYLLTTTIERAFDDGIYIAGVRYFYLGSSSSQMRDCGAYFMQGVTDQAMELFHRQFPGMTITDPRLSIKLSRQNLGRFLTLKTAPKIMARLGQCFTQSRVSRICLERHNYVIEPDIIGGRKKLVDEPYCFTDGVASMHPTFARRVSDDMQLNSVPSCYQYRFRGHKGVQVVDAYLQELGEWADRNKIPDPPGYKDIKGAWKVDCIFRPSQIKFTAKRYNEQPIEVVKFSGPTAVCLNKPLINIFDQVSGRQSRECHQRIVNRIEDLLNMQIRNIVRMLLVEKHCRNKLKEMPKRVDVDRLSQMYGFELCREPFFSSMLRAAVRFMIMKQLRKEQIQVLPSLGRSLLGVNDTSNRLQYGQVFVQYTNDMRDYSPRENALKTVVTGKVMVTKNPTSVMGDLRLFEAVDIPALRHLVDVIVFPVHGPRPMPDEMAGSDLDGDEYSVFWDPKLFIDYNEEPAIYESEPKHVAEVTKENLDEKVRDAFIDYVKNDNIGGISNALLFQSDLYGIDSRVVNDLALKANQALEFLKSGIPPERLRTDWVQADECDPSSEWLPPEKAERYPDFHIGNDYCPIYVSPRLTGKLYREIKLIEDVLRVVQEKDENRVLELDPLLEFEGWEAYREIAQETMDSYNGKLRAVMETYGIKTEAEVMSNCIVDMRNRITDKDQDDFSYYNQRSAIESRTTEIMREFREKFFEEFGGWRTCTREDDYRDEGNIFRRKTVFISDDVKRKASAYYMTAYTKYRNPRPGQTRMLSFAWLMFDVLANIRQYRVYSMEEHVVHDLPILPMLDKHIADFTAAYSTRRAAFWQEREQIPIIRKYCTKYPGLEDVLFVIEEWANFNGPANHRFSGSPLTLFFLLFATGHVASVAGNAKVHLEWINRFEEPLEGNVELKNKGELVLAFFEYLSSRKFKTLSHISFAELGVHKVFLRGEWMDMHQAAVKTYLSIAFSMNFDDLPIDKMCRVRTQVSHEMDPFIIEIPEHSDVNEIAMQLKVATGVEEVKVRRIVTRRRSDRAVVVCRGPLDHCYKLRSLVAVKPSLYTKYNPKELSEMLPTITLSHIRRAYEEATSASSSISSGSFSS